LGKGTVNMERALRYAPHLYFDVKEPFFPVAVGVTELRKGDESPSFKRTFDWEDASPELEFILEYAIYWDYDIQHLYEMEHVWIYVAADGTVLDAEASFHGKYFKGLLKDRSNLEEETHVRLYSQPGKHAFLPQPELFELVPNLRKATQAAAGMDGLLITGPFTQVLRKDAETDRIVQEYLKSTAFEPSMEFATYSLAKEQFMTWGELFALVPQRIEQCLADLRRK
jgi:hypothetical protein